ncbi:MAG: hypothetical protein JRJ29_09060 [Deltaproteobacteria bacterium]|nr:hypothetical protein [Deltaproteobacteria bacterium]
MRTTLDIEEDVLMAVKDLARRERVSVGRILSKLAREALAGPRPPERDGRGEERAVGGFRPFPPRGRVVSNEQVDRLRDQEGV